MQENNYSVYASQLSQTDPELAKILDNFIYEVQTDVDLPVRVKMLSTLAYLLGIQGLEEYKIMLPVALDNAVTPIEAKEVMYQAIDYLGLGRIMPFIQITNDVLASRGIKLPLENQATTTSANRLEKGEEIQIHFFGSNMKGASKKGIINKWLAANCFGDYYTRNGLSDKNRELITFCFLASQGSVEPQLLIHAKANINLGNDHDFLIKIVLQNVQFIGYPRSLNAIRIINQATKELTKE